STSTPQRLCTNRGERRGVSPPVRRSPPAGLRRAARLWIVSHALTLAPLPSGARGLLDQTATASAHTAPPPAPASRRSRGRARGSPATVLLQRAADVRPAVHHHPAALAADALQRRRQRPEHRIDALAP